jgi:multidrug efflux pump subunit AcrA (membrane-fusion protein)
MTTPATSRPPAIASLAAVRTPRAAVALTWVLLAGVVALPVALARVPWTQTVHGGGRAIAFDPVQRPQFLVSPIEGRVTKWYVVEGQRVTKGQRVLDLADNDPERLKRLEAEEKAIADRVTAAANRIAAIENQINFLQLSRKSALDMAGNILREQQFRQQVAENLLLEAQTQLELAEPNYNRVLRLKQNADGGLASARDLEVAKQGLDGAKARVKQFTGQVELAKTSVKVATESIRKVEADNDAMIESQTGTKNSALAELAAAKQALQQIQSAVERQKAQYVDAPTDGVIWQLLANAEAGGILVRPGERLARLVPDVKPKAAVTAEFVVGLSALAPAVFARESREYPGIVVEIGIDGNDLPLVREGDPVRLQFEGWPAVQFVGWPSVAVGTFAGRVYLVDPTANETGKFRILVEPDPNERPWPDQDYLRQGVRAQGWVLLEEVTAGWEIWRQINGFPPVRDEKDKPTGGPLGPVPQRKSK